MKVNTDVIRINNHFLIFVEFCLFFLLFNEFTEVQFLVFYFENTLSTMLPLFFNFSANTVSSVYFFLIFVWRFLNSDMFLGSLQNYDCIEVICGLLLLLRKATLTLYCCLFNLFLFWFPSSNLIAWSMSIIFDSYVSCMLISCSILFLRQLISFLSSAWCY